MAAFDIGQMPANVFFEYIMSSEASDNDTGWALGASIGQAKNRGEMQFSYYYADKSDYDRLMIDMQWKWKYAPGNTMSEVTSWNQPA